MSDNWRRSLERLRKHYEAVDTGKENNSPFYSDWLKMFMNSDFQDALCDVVCRALEQNRSDDTEEITEDWLRECGFCSSKFADDRSNLLYFDFGPDDDGDYVRLCVYAVDDGWNGYLNNFCDSCVHLPRPPQTKGDLRQLMRGFGQEI